MHASFLFNRLIHKKSAEEALAFLRDQRNEKPCIILLDLNMPRMNGIEFLAITKQDRDLRRIPTIVLTTSREDRDKSASFRRNIAGYIVKPIEYSQFVEAIRTVDSYWTLNQFPE